MKSVVVVDENEAQRRRGAAAGANSLATVKEYPLRLRRNASNSSSSTTVGLTERSLNVTTRLMANTGINKLNFALNKVILLYVCYF